MLEAVLGTGVQLAAENSHRAAGGGEPCSLPASRAKWPLSARCLGNSASSPSSRPGCTVPLPGQLQGRGAQDPAPQSPHAHACSVPRLCAGGFGGITRKNAGFCLVGACVQRVLRARAAMPSVTPARSTAVRTGAPACPGPPTTPACALPTTQVTGVGAGWPHGLTIPSAGRARCFSGV